ncbi:MAG: hypothetical protein KJP04_08180, partial [Arenicella sp.]|nr:hypothetical protein [Arenicella sp.]
MARAKSKVAARRRSQEDLIIPVSTWRYSFIALIFGAAFIALISRAVYLQVIDTEYLQSQGDARYLRVQTTQPTRGMILDRNDQPLAI